MCDTPWHPPNWIHIDKHFRWPGLCSWTDVVRNTGRGRREAKFRITKNRVEEIGNEFVQCEQVQFNGVDEALQDNVGYAYTSKNGNVRFFYVIADEIIGASLGQETKIMIINRQNDPTHAYPITKDELQEILQKENIDEFERFKNRWQHEEL